MVRWPIAERCVHSQSQSHRRVICCELPVLAHGVVVMGDEVIAGSLSWLVCVYHWNSNYMRSCDELTHARAHVQPAHSQALEVHTHPEFSLIPSEPSQQGSQCVLHCLPSVWVFFLFIYSFSIVSLASPPGNYLCGQLSLFLMSGCIPRHTQLVTGADPGLL